MSEHSMRKRASDLAKAQIYRTYRVGKKAAQIAQDGEAAILELLELGLAAKKRQDDSDEQGEHLHEIAIPDPLWKVIEQNAQHDGKSPDEWIVDAAYAYVFNENEAESESKTGGESENED